MIEDLNLIFTSNLIDKNKEVVFLKIGNINENRVINLKKNLEKILTKKNYLFTDKKVYINENHNIILLVEFGITSKAELNKINLQINRQKTSISGVIYLNNNEYNLE